MTSEQRRELRYQRRRMKRLVKKRKRYESALSLNRTYTFMNTWRAYKQIRRGKAFKGSVQRLIFYAPIRVVRYRRKILSGKYRCLPPFEWDTWERGHLRHIKSTTADERVIHCTYNNNVLVPIIYPSLIYDNGACMRHKGGDFFIRRQKVHLHRAFRKYGNSGYVLILDFKKYYDNIDQELIEKRNMKRIPDPSVRGFGRMILKSMGETGIALGNQTSPIYALDAANELDHYIKEVLGIKEFGRYNDDSCLFSDSKERLKYCFEKIKEKCAELHIYINEKKTQIVKLSHGFKSLKARIYLLDSGKVLRKVPKERVVVERRKLKKLKKKLLEGTIDLKHIEMSYQCWRSYVLKYFTAWHTVVNMDKLYYALFPDAHRIKLRPRHKKEPNQYGPKKPTSPWRIVKRKKMKAKRKIAKQVA